MLEQEGESSEERTEQTSSDLASAAVTAQSVRGLQEWHLTPSSQTEAEV